MDLNFPVFATGVRIFRANNDVGSLFVDPGSTRILEMFFSSIHVDAGSTNRGSISLLALKIRTPVHGKHGEIKVHRSNACVHSY